MRKEKLKARGVRIPSAIWESLCAEAEELSTTPSVIIRRVLEQYYYHKGVTESVD